MCLSPNDILKNVITKITDTLLPPGFEGDARSIRLMQDSVSKLINNLGELSAQEQGLSRVVTSADKLRTADAHTLYLYNDANANGGKGEVLGMLKVGYKHLFLFDLKEVVREVEPLCVLDFFVLRKCQRAGIGKILFDFMLQDWNKVADELAVDGPSVRMEAFLGKHYGVPFLIRQSNNFAITPRFFDALPGTSKSSASTPSLSAAAVGRYTARRPESSIAEVIHGEALNDTGPPLPKPPLQAEPRRPRYNPNRNAHTDFFG